MAVSCIVVSAIGIFAAYGSVTRKARITGVIVPVDGSAAIAATTAGVLKRIHVREGDAVIAGQPLFELATERQGKAGELSELVAQQLATRQASLESERRLRQSQHRDKLQNIRERQHNLEAETDKLEQEIALAKRREELARQTLSKFEVLQQSGYISYAQLQQKQEDLLDVTGKLNALERGKVQSSPQSTSHRCLRSPQTAESRHDLERRCETGSASDLGMGGRTAARGRQFQVMATISERNTQSIILKGNQKMLIDDLPATHSLANAEIKNFDGSFVRIDNLLNDTELAALQEYFQEHVFWKYGWKSASDKMVFGHWNHDILKTHKSNQDDHSPLLEQDPSLSPVNTVWKKLKNSFLRDHHLVRCYANAHSYGVEGYPHVDSKRPGNFTAILYLNPIWKPEWAGETVFFNEENDIVQAVLPKSGRIAIFDNRVLHAARGVSRICPAIRVTLMFKTKLVGADTDDEEFYGRT